MVTASILASPFHTDVTAGASSLSIQSQSPTELDDICNQAATGGTIKAVTIGADIFCRHTFTTVGSSTFTVRDSRISRVDYLVVAGGGGGADRVSGGGGGAGGVVSNLKPGGTNSSGALVTANTPISVVVGAGGAGGQVVATNTIVSEQGGNSSFGSLPNAVGGGPGGRYAEDSLSRLAGGSGGGSGRHLNTSNSSATSGQGNSGGRGSGTTGGGGGGGGAGAVGANAPASATDSASQGGAGGAGLDYSTFFGSDIGNSGWFAGGGAGAASNASTAAQALGGQGGGGNEGVRDSGGGFAGVANTGGGGGAARNYSSGNGGNGGSGIVVVRYALPTPKVQLPPSTQQATIGQDVVVTTMNSRGPAVSPRIFGLGGNVTANVSITFGEVSITDLHGATAADSYAQGEFQSSITVSGTATQVNAALETLTVKSAAEGLGTLTVSANDTPRENSASAQTIIYFSGSEILVPTTTVTGETLQWRNVDQVTGQPVKLEGFSENVTVTIDSNQPNNVRFRLQGLSAQNPGQITAPQANLAAFASGSNGAGVIVINGPVSEVNSALASLQVWADSTSNATVTVQASAGAGQVFDGNGHTYRIVRLNRSISWMQAYAAAAATKIPASGGGYCQGYLVTITSEAERRYVNSKVGGQLVWLGASDQPSTRGVDADGNPAPYILNGEEMSYVTAAHMLNGDTRSAADAKAIEGDFYWVTGPERGTLLSSGNWRGTVQTGTRPISNQSPAEAFRDINGNIGNYPWGNGEPNNFKLDDPGEDFAHILTNGNWNDYRWNNGSVRAFVIEYGGIRATANHKTYPNAPLGTVKDLNDFEAQIDQNLTDPDYVGVREPCLGVSADTNKSATFALNLLPRPEPRATLGNVTGVGYTPNASPANSQTDLTLNADVSLDGATIASIEFEYTVTSPGASADFTSATKVSASTTTGSGYKVDLTAQPNESFVNYRLVVTFAGGIASITTASASFRTLAAPTVLTGDAAISGGLSSSNSYTMTLDGTINANNVTSSDALNNITAAEFLVGESADLSDAVSYRVTSALPTGNSDTRVALDIENLVAGKTYYFALRATNAAGTNTGGIRSFSVAGAPNVTTLQPSFAADGMVVLSGRVNPNLETLIKVEISLDAINVADPDTRLLEIVHNAPDGNVEIEYSYEIPELTAGDYVFRLEAENSLGRSVGNIVHFSVVGPGVPTSLQGSAVSATSISINWQAPAAGATVIDYQIEYAEYSGVCGSYQIYPALPSTLTQRVLTDLRPDTEYCLRVSSVALNGVSGATDVVTIKTPIAQVGATPYIGPIVTGVGSDPFSHRAVVRPGARVTLTGQRLASVSRVKIGNREIAIVASGDRELVLALPEDLAPGHYDLVLIGSFGTLTIQSALTITDSVSQVPSNEMRYWMRRISASQAKVYVMNPTVGSSIQILHQVGGSGNYRRVFARTVQSESVPFLRQGASGGYVVRTIQLGEVNRIRVVIDGVAVRHVRYNNPSTN
jgi:hypothetical protein